MIPTTVVTPTTTPTCTTKQPTFKETINVPFHEFVKKTNMNLDITKRTTEDNGDQPPIPHADEQDMELQVVVSPPAYPIKPILKTLVHDTIVNRSPTRTPEPTNEIRDSMTSSPSSPQSPELPTKQRPRQTKTTSTAVYDSHKAGDPPSTPQPKPASPQHQKQDGSNGP